jgi:Minichromosome loss protein, Mcl1, middle region
LDIQMIGSIAEMPSAPTELLWQNEDTAALYVACANGSMTQLPGEVIIETIQKTKKSMASSVREADSLKKKIGSHAAIPDTAKMADSDDDDDVFRSDDDGKGATKASNPFIDDEAEDSDDDSINPEIVRNAKDGQKPRYPEDDFDEDDHLSTGGMDDYRAATAYPVASKLHPLQAPFAPSSSPLDLTRRFLCWNHVGSVTLRHVEGGGEGRNIVDIHFTDSGVRRPISFTDTLGFILGSVGEDGGVFATDCVEDDDDDDDDDLLGDVAVLSEKTRQAVRKSRRKQRDPNQAPSGSTIYFHRFETFASLRDKDWYLTLPNGERVLGCATGAGWVAVMTRSVSSVVRKRQFLNLIFATLTIPPSTVDVSSVFSRRVVIRGKFCGFMDLPLRWLGAIGFSPYSFIKENPTVMGHKTLDSNSSMPFPIGY